MAKQTAQAKKVYIEDEKPLLQVPAN